MAVTIHSYLFILKYVIYSSVYIASGMEMQALNNNIQEAETGDSL